MSQRTDVLEERKLLLCKDGKTIPVSSTTDRQKCALILGF
jgi:hypothetical protein